jgi:hypothetical protein
VCITTKDVIAWGSNEYGQLGHGDHAPDVCSRPCAIKVLHDVMVTQVSTSVLLISDDGLLVHVSCSASCTREVPAAHAAERISQAACRISSLCVVLGCCRLPVGASTPSV